jgi:hypothetical protein
MKNYSVFCTIARKVKNSTIFSNKHVITSCSNGSLPFWVSGALHDEEKRCSVKSLVQQFFQLCYLWG